MRMKRRATRHLSPAIKQNSTKQISDAEEKAPSHGLWEGAFIASVQSDAGIEKQVHILHAVTGNFPPVVSAEEKTAPALL